jgi:hypothetical protein
VFPPSPWSSPPEGNFIRRSNLPLHPPYPLSPCPHSMDELRGVFEHVLTDFGLWANDVAFQQRWGPEWQKFTTSLEAVVKVLASGAQLLYIAPSHLVYSISGCLSYGRRLVGTFPSPCARRLSVCVRTDVIEVSSAPSEPLAFAPPSTSPGAPRQATDP